MNQPNAFRNQDLTAAVAEAEAGYVAANPKSLALSTAAQAHLPGGNTRTTVHFSPFPLYVETGRGSRLTDADGHSYADFVNEYTAGIYGHSHPVIAKAITDTVAQGLNFGAPTRHEIDLSGEIRRRFPAMDLLRFCNSGTEANLLALATARAVSGKQAILIFKGAYHGSILYWSHGPSPLNMPFPVIESRFNDVDRMRRDIADHAAELAAVIVEPMQGGAGAIAGTGDFLQALREVTEAHGIILIFDEVMSSRCHIGGVQAIHGIRPDMVTLGKYIAGGLSIGAFGGSASIMSRFDPSRPDAFPHGGTFNNNVIAMAAGHAALTQVLTPDASSRMNQRGDRLRDLINAAADDRGLPVVSTGLGSVFGIHFHQGAIRNDDDLDAGEQGREPGIAALKKLYHLDMLAAGQFVSRRIMGCLSVETTEAEVDSLAAATAEFMDSRGALIRQVFA